MDETSYVDCPTPAWNYHVCRHYSSCDIETVGSLSTSCGLSHVPFACQRLMNVSQTQWQFYSHRNGYILITPAPFRSVLHLGYIRMNQARDPRRSKVSYR